jgi:hypothetical protein
MVIFARTGTCWKCSRRDLRRDVSAASLGQPALGEAPLTVVFTAVYARTMRKYGARAPLC